METKKMSVPSGYSWTNERHMHYLSSMEASFVRSMLQNPRLDRYLPDSSESTLDLKTVRRRRRHSTSDIPDARTRSDRKTGRLSSKPYTSSHDQVVPQVENGTVDNVARGHPDVPAVTSAAPPN